MKRKPSPPANAASAVDAIIAARVKKAFNGDATTLAEDLQDLWPGVTPFHVHQYCGAFLANADWWVGNVELEKQWRRDVRAARSTQGRSA